MANTDRSPFAVSIRVQLKRVQDSAAAALMVVLQDVMCRDIVTGNYRVDLRSIVVSEFVEGLRSRYLFDVDAGDSKVFEAIVIQGDPKLLNYILANALSNAYKYGERKVIPTLRVSYSRFGRLRFAVENQAGSGHARLVAMDPHKLQQQVFGIGSRLEQDDGDKHAHTSRGDGMWIAKQCADVHSAEVKLEVFPEFVQFVLSLQAPRVLTDTDMEQLVLNDEVVFVVLDDQSFQLEIMTQHLQDPLFGRVKDVTLFLRGQSCAEICNFVTYCVDLRKRLPKAYLMLIIDQNVRLACCAPLSVIRPFPVLHTLLRRKNNNACVWSCCFLSRLV